MSDALRDLAASVVVTGLSDGDLEDAELARYGFGGFVLFDRNCESLARARRLADRIRARYAALPPVIAIDQEGGRVMRLREGVSAMPSAAEIGASSDARLAEATGARCAYDLRRAGCNLDLAPVLDLALDPKNRVIGDRSFGANPELVTAMGRAFASGLEAGGVVATFKHFPGHGATATDSHEALPTIDVDEATLRTRDLVPFAACARTARAFMTAHVVVPAFDASAPATLSKRILQGLLRDELGFRGVCFTDCLQMAAIANGVGSVDGAVLALDAGADVVTVSHDPRLAVEIVERVVRAVEERHLALDRLREASERMAALRAQLAPPIGA